MLGIGLGALAGWKRGSRLDAIIPATTLLTAMPYFFLALIMLYLFSSNVWHVFPQGQGYDTNSELSPGWNLPFLASAVQHAILPALTIVLQLGQTHRVRSETCHLADHLRRVG